MVTLDSSLAALKIALTQTAATGSVNQNSNRASSNQSSTAGSSVVTEAVRLSQAATTTLNNQRYLSAAYKAQAMLQTADKAASSITTKLEDLRKLAVKATSSTLSDSERALLSADFQGKRSSLLTMTQTARWNGMRLFDGSAGTQRNGTLSFQVGSGTSGQLDVVLPNLRQDSVRMSGVRSVQGSYATGLSERQTIDASSTNLANKSAVLSFGDVSLSSGDLGASASVSDLVSGLTSHANYADAPFTITDSGSNTLSLSWKNNGVISSTAQLQLTANAQTRSSTRITTGVSEADLPAVAEQQFITLSDANLSTATSLVITDSSESQNSYGISFDAGSATISSLVDAFNTNYAASMPFTLSAESDGVRLNWNSTGAQSGTASIVVSSFDSTNSAYSTAVFDATQTVVGASAGVKEKQSVALSDSAIQGQTITLTANGTTLSSGQMASSASLSDFVTALQSDANYATAGFELSLDSIDGSTGSLMLNWASPAAVSDLASLSILDTSSTLSLTASQRQAGSDTNTSDGTNEVQLIAVSSSKIAGKNVQLRFGDFSMFSGQLSSDTSVQQMVDSFTANANYDLAPFTLSQNTPGYLSVTWKKHGPVNQLAILDVHHANPLRSLMKNGSISSQQAASSMAASIDIALKTMADARTTIGIAGVQLTSAVEKLASTTNSINRSLIGSNSNSYAKNIASLLRSQMADNSLQAAWAQASLSSSEVANTLA
jgi:flagellin-like hook-associated protein FlgL